MNRTEFAKVTKAIKNPAKIAIAIVKTPAEKFNMITLEWFMRTSIQPPMFAISIGHTRYSYECLQNNRFFNLCFPSQEMVEIAKISGSFSGRDIDKFERTKVEFFSGRLNKYPILKKAKANFECEVTTQVRSGDHTIFVGKVKHSWLDPIKKVLTYRDFE